MRRREVDAFFVGKIEPDVSLHFAQRIGAHFDARDFDVLSRHERGDVRAVFDVGVTEKEVVFCGVGRNDRSLEVGARDLVRAANGRVAAIAKDEAKASE